MKMSILFFALLLVGLVGGPAVAGTYDIATVAITTDVWGLAFSPDSSILAVGDVQPKVTLIDPAAGKLLRRIDGHKAMIRSVAFTPDGASVVSAGYDNVMKFWDPETGAPRSEIKDTVSNYYPSFSQDGKVLVTASDSNDAKVWDPATGAVVRKLVGHTDTTWCACISKDGKLAITGSVDKTAKLWDVNTGLCIRTFHGHTEPVKDVEFSPDCKTIASASPDGTVRLWDAATGACLGVIYAHSKGTEDVAFSPDGMYLASVGKDDELKIWDLKTRQITRSIRQANRCVAFSPDGRFIATATDHCWVTVRDWKRMRRTIVSAKGRHDLRPELESYGLAAPSNGNPKSAGAVFTTTEMMAFALAKRAGKAQPLSENYLLWAIDRSPDLRGDMLSLYRRYGICDDDLMPYVEAPEKTKAPDTKIAEPSDEAKRDAEAKRQAGLNVHVIESFPSGPRPSDGYVSQIKKVIDKGYPVGALTGDSLTLVAYIDDPDQEGGGVFITRDPYNMSYRTVNYEYARTNMGGFVWWE